MAAPLPWLRQGDVFETVPYVHLEASDHGHRVVNEEFAGLLVSENCQLDKRTGRGLPRPGQRLLFLPVRPLEVFDPNHQSKMLAGEVQPPEAVYVGEFEGERLAARLGEIFSLPAAIFSPRSVNYSGHPDADPADPHHLTVDARWTRLMTMDAEALQLMHRKMWMFMTHREPEPY